MKRHLPTILITLGHATLTTLLFLLAFSTGMSRFDSGAPSTPGERLLEWAAEIMMFPLVSPIVHWNLGWFNRLFPGLFGYIPLLLNSLIWALVIRWLWRRIKGAATPA